jgi:hypothetical protein
MDNEKLRFPRSLLSGVAGDFSKLYGAYTEAPECFYFISFLTILGNLISDRLTMDSELEPQPRLNALLLGASGTLRKSSAVDATVKFFHDSVDDFTICRGVGSGEGLAARLDEKNKLVLFFDEVKALVEKCKTQGSVLMSTLTTLYESNHYENSTKTSCVKIDNAYLSVIACSTIETFEAIWNSNMSDIGLTNRMLLIPGSSDKRFAIPKRIPQIEKENIRHRLGEILKMVGDDKVLSVEPEALDCYEDWYDNRDIDEHSTRLDGYAMRLMMLFCINDGKYEIDCDSVLKAIMFCDWQHKVRQELTPVEADNAVAKLEQKMRQKLEGKKLSRNELARATNGYRSGIWYFEKAIENLIGAGEVEYSKSTKKYSKVVEVKNSITNRITELKSVN